MPRSKFAYIRLRTASSAVSMPNTRMLVERSCRSMLVMRLSKPTLDWRLKKESAPVTYRSYLSAMSRASVSGWPLSISWKSESVGTPCPSAHLEYAASTHLVMIDLSASGRPSEDSAIIALERARNASILNASWAASARPSTSERSKGLSAVSASGASRTFTPPKASMRFPYSPAGSKMMISSSG